MKYGRNKQYNEKENTHSSTTDDFTSSVSLVANSLDLKQSINFKPCSTFFGRVSGHSLKNAGIDNGDLMIIDKSLNPQHGKIAVCFLNGDFSAKRINLINNTLGLMPENDD